MSGLDVRENGGEGAASVELALRLASASTLAAGASDALAVVLERCGATRAVLLAAGSGSLDVVAWAGLEPQPFSVRLGELERTAIRLLHRDDAGAFDAADESLPIAPGVALPYRDGGGRAAGVVLVDRASDEGQRHAVALLRSIGPALARRAVDDEHRRRADDADRQQDLLVALLDSLPDPIVITGAARQLLVQNKRAEHLLQADAHATEGRHRAVEINDLLLTTYLQKAGDGRVGGPRDLNLVDPDDGADLLFEVLSRPLPAGVAPEGARVSVLRDVTDLRRAAGELERQVQRVRRAEVEASRERDRLNLILANVGDPILVTDAASRIVLMNREAEQLFGTVPDEGADGDPTGRQAVRGNDTKFTAMIAGFAGRDEGTLRHEMRLRHPRTGAEFPVEVVSGKVFDEGGATAAVVSVFHDLTKQVENETLYEALKRLYGELEERVRAATADLAEQNRQLHWQAEELEKANRLKSDFLASMSHELRTPINALIGYSALMLDRLFGELTEQQVGGLKRMQGAANHLRELVNDILDLARIEAGRMPVHVEAVRLADVVEEMAEQVAPMVREKRLRFERAVPADLPLLRTDRLKVKQILLNLLSNAVKFTHEGGVTVTVRATDDGGAVVTVADSGIGIAMEHQDAIWEDFRQVDQSRTREYGGTGLGLSIVRKLAAALGGSVSMTSEPGRGSTFVVELPACAPGSDEDPAAPSD